VQQGGYIESDAAEEASHIGGIMRPAVLTPFLLQGRFDSMEKLNAAVDKERQRLGSPAIFVLGAGNIGLPLILNIAIGLSAGKTVYARASRRNIDAVRTWVSAVKSCGHPLAQAVHQRINLLEIEHEGRAYGETLSQLPVQQAYLWGGDEALRTTAEWLRPRLGEQVYFFGPRTGVLLLDCSYWKAQRDADKRSLAQALYDNLLMYDAALCSSPTLGVVVGEEAEARAVLDEVASLVAASPNERQRLSRLGADNARRQRMRQWVAHGYSVHRAKDSLVTFALGALDAYRDKNLYLPPAETFHSSAGSLELLCFTQKELAEAASLIAGLQSEPRFMGHLWSVGHLITVASAPLTRQLTDLIAQAQKSLKAKSAAPHLLDAAHLRIVELRKNFVREPGELFDGVSLIESMLPPSDNTQAL
jgi:hypothetical protein